MKKYLLLAVLATLSMVTVTAQENDNKTGAWYMYFFNTTFKESAWGVQGDIQYRNWNLGGDLEQLLLRGGITYSPKDANIKLTLGYGHITSGAYGDDSSTSAESRIYQEAIFPSKIGQRIFINHRFRYEQRFVDNQDFRTRYRYNLFVNVPFNSATITEKTVYLALYNELFINGQKDIGDGRSVETFDRNRLYGAIGYVLKKGLKMQLGIMRQTTNAKSKNQLQLSVHHNF